MKETVQNNRRPFSLPAIDASFLASRELSRGLQRLKPVLLFGHLLFEGRNVPPLL
jgi:hypothetical protein